MSETFNILRSILIPNQRTTQREIMDIKRFHTLFKRQNMEDFKQRLKTFINGAWTGKMSVIDLAKAGFCYTGTSEEVVCYECKGTISHWGKCDVPVKLHMKIYAQCVFAISHYREAFKKRGRVSFDNSTQKDDVEDEMYFFKSEFNRLMSFKNWPLSSPVDRYDLAATGFYCTENMSVICVGCFGLVSDWKLGDRPKDKHNKSCRFADNQSEEREIQTPEIRQFIKTECVVTK